MIREYDPFTAGQDGNAYAEYRWLRDVHPVYHSERHGFYAVSRYDDVRDVSRNWRVYSNRDGVDIDHGGTVGGPNFLDQDPPEHDYWRRLFQARFAAKAVRDALTDVIEREATRLLDEALADDPKTVDLGKQFAWELPIAVTGYLLGVPKIDQHTLSEDLRLFQERDPGDVVPPQRAVDAAARLNDYLAELVRERRKNPSDDLISLMATAERDGRPLPDADVNGNTFFILDAGTHTTSCLISQALVLLDRNREQREWLSKHRSHIDRAIEELLRYESPLKFLRRTTLEEITVHDKTVPAGSSVFMLYCAANRDDRKWADADTLDLSRKPERHMALGEGIHFCMGAPIARFEAKIALEAILDRLPDYEVCGPSERMQSHMMNGYTSIPASVGR
jgi:cytochrome P450